MNAKRNAVIERIESLDQAIRRAKEYLQNGRYADWHKFRPLFGRKSDLPPHKDWVKNVFLPRKEKALTHAEKVLERLGERERSRAR